MPQQEELVYKVQIDSSDIASQLEQIREQVNMAVGANSFSMAPPPPELSSIAPMGVDAGVPPIYQTINSQTANFGSAVQAMDNSQGLFQTLNQNYEAFRLGYSKFTGGMSQLGLLQPPAPPVSYPTAGISAYTQMVEAAGAMGAGRGGLFTATGIPAMQGSMPSLAMGSMGFGYDPNTMPVSRQEFQNLYSSAAERRFSEFFVNNGFSLAGTVAGASVGAAFGAGIPGAMVGGTIGFAGDLLVSAGLARERENRQIGAGLQAISRNTGIRGGLSTGESRDMARGIMGMADTFESRVSDLGRDDIQGMILNFANEGGFESTRTAEEFRQTAKDVIENTRSVMRALRMTQDEATSMMAELSRDGMVSAGGVGAWASMTGATAASFGMKGVDLVNFSHQGAEMFRGSGIGMAGGMDMLQEARLQSQFMMQEGGSMTNRMFREMGGIDSATINLAQKGSNFMHTAVGQILYNAQRKGAYDATDPASIMNATAGMDIFDWYNQEYDIDQNPADASRMARNQIELPLVQYGQAFEISRGRKMGADDLEGFFYHMQRTGRAESIDQARLMFQSAYTDKSQSLSLQQDAIQGAINKMYQGEVYSRWDRFTANVGQGWNDNVMNPLRRFAGGVENIVMDHTGVIGGAIEGIGDAITGVSTTHFQTASDIAGNMANQTAVNRIIGQGLNTNEKNLLASAVTSYGEVSYDIGMYNLPEVGSINAGDRVSNMFVHAGDKLGAVGADMTNVELDFLYLQGLGNVSPQGIATSKSAMGLLQNLGGGTLKGGINLLGLDNNGLFNQERFQNIYNALNLSATSPIAAARQARSVYTGDWAAGVASIQGAGIEGDAGSGEILQIAAQQVYGKPVSELGELELQVVTGMLSEADEGLFRRAVGQGKGSSQYGLEFSPDVIRGRGFENKSVRALSAFVEANKTSTVSDIMNMGRGASKATGNIGNLRARMEDGKMVLKTGGITGYDWTGIDFWGDSIDQDVMEFLKQEGLDTYLQDKVPEEFEAFKNAYVTGDPADAQTQDNLTKTFNNMLYQASLGKYDDDKGSGFMAMSLHGSSSMADLIRSSPEALKLLGLEGEESITDEQIIKAQISALVSDEAGFMEKVKGVSDIGTAWGTHTSKIVERGYITQQDRDNVMAENIIGSQIGTKIEGLEARSVSLQGKIFTAGDLQNLNHMMTEKVQIDQKLETAKLELQEQSKALTSVFGNLGSEASKKASAAIEEKYGISWEKGGEKIKDAISSLQEEGDSDDASVAGQKIQIANQEIIIGLLKEQLLR